MSETRIPLQQIFRAASFRKKSASVSSQDSNSSIESPTTSPEQSPAVKPLPRLPPAPRNRTSDPFTFAQFGRGLSSMSAPPMMRGTRTPQMLEYERQAEERAREMAQINEDRDRMADELAKITRDQERIAQEEYEMRQYYEAEALRHAEEMRLHKEEVRRHQERVRDHERRVKDHEASSEAFAKVIVMPAKGGRQISFMAPGAMKNGNGNGAVMNGMPKNVTNGTNGV